MKIVLEITKLILQYISGFIFAWGSLILFAFICPFCLGWYCKTFLPPPVAPDTFDDLYGDFIGGAGYLFVVLVCIPVGVNWGILMTDSLILKRSRAFLLKIILSLLIVILSSAIIFWFVLLILKYDVFLSDTRTLFFIFVCIPIGVIFGILIADKLILKRHKMFSLKIIISLLMAILGSAVIYLSEIYLRIGIFGWFPKIRHITFGYESFYITSTLFALIGYRVVGLFKHKKAKPILSTTVMKCSPRAE